MPKSPPKSILRRNKNKKPTTATRTLSFSDAPEVLLFERHPKIQEEQDSATALPPDFAPLAILNEDAQLAWNTARNLFNGVDPGTRRILPQRVRQVSKGPVLQAFVDLKKTAVLRDVHLWHSKELEPFLRRRCGDILPLVQNEPLRAEDELRVLHDFVLRQRTCLEAARLPWAVPWLEKYLNCFFSMFCAAKINADPTKFERLRDASVRYPLWWE
jgi:hypothetical protein